MRHTKLPKGRGHKLPIRHSRSLALRDQTEAVRSAGKKTAPKKTAPKEADSARPLRKELNSKADKLLCRYCGWWVPASAAMPSDTRPFSVVTSSPACVA